jgi:predicted transcriptional regulator
MPPPSTAGHWNHIAFLHVELCIRIATQAGLKNQQVISSEMGTTTKAVEEWIRQIVMPTNC